MAVPFLDLHAQYRSIKPAIDSAIQGIIENSAFALGPGVEQFERDFAAFCGVRHCIGLNSGTAALALLLQAHGIGSNDEVITAANTFFATAEAISLVGGTPVLVDCREDDALMDATKLEAAVTPKTRAIIPVHLYGQPADMDAIVEIARRHNLLVFEDACQAHGARYKTRRAGSLANGAAFSFYPGKNLGAYGEAGAVTTNDDEIAHRIRMLRDHGMPKKYHHEFVGWNERMDGIQGAVLSVKLPHLDQWNAARSAHGATYRKLLPPDVFPIVESPDREHVYHLFVIRTPQRDDVAAHLQARGIQTIVHYPVPIHLQPAYASRGWKRGDFPVAEKLTGEILSLPLYPEMTEAQIQEVCTAITEFFGASSAT
jgi:dTDP-4-amino-4,6-dideoxygalactose transaminase